MQLQRRESLSARLRSEVQVSAALWKIGDKENAVSSDSKPGGTSLPSALIAPTGNVESVWPCPREVKPLIFFYKYLQPIGAAEIIGTGGNDNTSSVPVGTGSSSSLKKLKINLPLTVVCERANGQEIVLWLRTDDQGNVIREDKTAMWRKKLHNELISATPASLTDLHDNDQALAVRSVARWKSNSSSSSSGGSAVVLTRRTLDPVLAVPCELPICVQQFVQCRGTQASVYRIFWAEQERKCFAVNLTNSLKNTEAPGEENTSESGSGPAASYVASSAAIAAVNAAFEFAMVAAADLARFYCVTASPDAQSCTRRPKLRGAAICEGVQATTRLVEHVQTQLPMLRFHSMTVDFIKDTSGVWWFIRVVDFDASSCVEPPRDNDNRFNSRDSAVLIPEFLRSKLGQTNPLDGESPIRRESASMRVEEANNPANTRICFLCGCSCEFASTFRSELMTLLKGQNDDGYREHSSNITMAIPAAAEEFRMTLTMALDTIFLMRQRGVALSAWESAVQTVRKAHLRDVCDFQVCLICYRIYQQQQRLQLISHELHGVLSGNDSGHFEKEERKSGSAVDRTDDTGFGKAASAANGLGVSQLLSTELRSTQQLPKRVLESIEAFRHEVIPPALKLRGEAPDPQPSWDIPTSVLRGTDVDPTATQLRLMLFFHELQDAGPDLVPTDFFLEYHLGQCVTRVQLEGSKRHTPNRWQLCEARAHYLCASLDAFSEFCATKQLLIKMKAKPGSLKHIEEHNSSKGGITGSRMNEPNSDSCSSDGDVSEYDANHNDTQSGQRKIGGQKRRRRREEFFGYALLSLRPLITAAKSFGNSLKPECRTDYLLELHTKFYAPLTLKLTVGVLVDPVPLGHIRDVLRDCMFLEEQSPCGIYWPPPAHFLSGLAVPRDWVGALMPSEYTKMLPMNSRKEHIARLASGGSQRARNNKASRLRNSTDMTAPSNTSTAATLTRRVSSAAITRTRAQSTLGLESAGIANSGSSPDLVIADEDQLKPERQGLPLNFVNMAMIVSTLTRTCLAARRIVFRISDDAAANQFPTALLAAILRHATFISSSPGSSNPPSFSISPWTSPAAFQFTRRYSVDRLLGEVKSGTVPMLALLGELLLVLLESHEVPLFVDAAALEPLLEPFWRQESGCRAIPRATSSCLPEYRVIWNRAVRRWEAGSSGTNSSGDIPQRLAWSDQHKVTDSNSKQAGESHVASFAASVGAFRAKTSALVLCELFEQMETLDNGYIEIAELRSLSKCLPKDSETLSCLQQQLDLEVGTRERLSRDDTIALAGLVELQRRQALWTLLHSLLESPGMMAVLSRFDRMGSSEMSLEEFQELASQTLLAQRNAFRTFHDEPKKPHDGFCLRHGFVDLYASDGVCVLCTAEYRADSSPAKVEEANSLAIDAADAFGWVGPGQQPGDAPCDAISERSADGNLPRCTTAPSVLQPPITSSIGDKPMLLDGRSRRVGILQTAVAKSVASRHMLDTALDTMLNRLHAAERTVVASEAQAGERRPSGVAARTRQPSISTATTSGAMRKNSSCSDLGRSTKNTASRRGTARAKQARQNDGPDTVTVTKKKVKKKAARKPARLQMSSPLSASTSLSTLLRMEFSDRKRALATSASEDIIGRAVRVEAKRKQMDRLVLAEIQEVKRRLAHLLEHS